MNAAMKFEWIDLPPEVLSGVIGKPGKFEWLGQDEGGTGTRETPGSPQFSRTAEIPVGVSQGMLFRVPGDERWHYVVANGDFPAKIADKGLGDRTRWTDLTRANPQKSKSTAEDCRRNPAQCPAGNFKNLFTNEVLLWPSNWPIDRVQSVDLFGAGGGKSGFSKAGVSGGTIALAVAFLAAVGFALAGRG